MEPINTNTNRFDHSAFWLWGQKTEPVANFGGVSEIFDFSVPYPILSGIATPLAQRDFGGLSIYDPQPLVTGWTLDPG